MMRDVYGKLQKFATASTGYIPLDELLPIEVLANSASSDMKWEIAVVAISGPAGQLLSGDIPSEARSSSHIPLSTHELRHYAQNHFPPIGGARGEHWELARSVVASPAELSYKPFTSAHRRRSALEVISQAVQAAISIRLMDGTLHVPKDNPYDSAPYNDPTKTLVISEDDILEVTDRWERQMYRWADGHADSPSLAAVVGTPAAEGAQATAQQFFITYLTISGAARNVIGDRWPNRNAQVNTQDVENELGVPQGTHPLSWPCAGHAIIQGTKDLPYDEFKTAQQRSAALLILIATARHIIRSLRDRYGPRSV